MGNMNKPKLLGGGKAAKYTFEDDDGTEAALEDEINDDIDVLADLTGQIQFHALGLQARLDADPNQAKRIADKVRRCQEQCVSFFMLTSFRSTKPMTKLSGITRRSTVFAKTMPYRCCACRGVGVKIGTPRTWKLLSPGFQAIRRSKKLSSHFLLLPNIILLPQGYLLCISSELEKC